MSNVNHKEVHVGRRDFIKATAIAGVAVNLPGAKLVAQNTEGPPKAKHGGAKKKLLCLTDNQIVHERLIESIRSLPATDLLISHIKANYQRPQEIIDTVRSHGPDFLFMSLPLFTFNFGALYDSMGDLDAPVIILSSNPELSMIDANLAASLRGNGANVTFTISEAQALEAVRIAVSPRILEGKRAVLYGKPFNSTTVPSRNLTEGYVYERTGVRIQHRPLEELTELLKGVNESAARSEMERWEKEAAEVIRVSDKAILDACKLYILLRSIMEKEGLSAVSIDCLGFTMNPNPVLPYPCLAFARLRDEGLTAACESDLCGLLSSMFMQEISGKPSFMCNVVSVKVPSSIIILSHCVAPLKLNGADAAPMRYRLHDYHNFGRGVVPEVEFPVGAEVVTGGFSKNLRSFSVWPGRIQSQAKNTDSSSGKMLMLNVCANTMEVRIRDAEHFLQNITGIHHIMVIGNYAKEIEDALHTMNMDIDRPSDLTPPDL
ncbi:MAG: twin-arginine translocation signal domain-containing protein [Acidobacteria bacterium]|nr:twin-arginine translocation signal domain-containing protein [Acidobacteriota bacterium]